jgi:hypothetical protein
MMRVRSFVACLAVALLATTFVGGGAAARATVICKEKAGAECPCERSTKCSEKTELQASREKYEEAKEADKQKYEEDAERIYDKYCNPYSEKICGDWPNAKAKQELARAKDKYKERLAKAKERYEARVKRIHEKHGDKTEKAEREEQEEQKEKEEREHEEP